METRDERLDEAQLRNMSTAELVRHALDEAKLLAKAEVLHAKQELKQELTQAKMTGVLFGAAVATALSGLTLLFVALALVLPLAEPLAAVVVGGGLLAVAAVCAVMGLKGLPKKPLPKTQERIKKDFAITREQLA